MFKVTAHMCFATAIGAAAVLGVGCSCSAPVDPALTWPQCCARPPPSVLASAIISTGSFEGSGVFHYIVLNAGLK